MPERESGEGSKESFVVELAKEAVARTMSTADASLGEAKRHSGTAEPSLRVERRPVVVLEDPTPTDRSARKSSKEEEGSRDKDSREREGLGTRSDTSVAVGSVGSSTSSRRGSGVGAPEMAREEER